MLTFWWKNDDNVEKKEKPILFAANWERGTVIWPFPIQKIRHLPQRGRPIKCIVNELSKYAAVILTPEDNTSQLCNKCGDKVEHVKVCKFKSKKEILNMGELEKKIRKIIYFQKWIQYT